MIRLLIFILFLAATCYASDNHERGDSHRVVYTILDTDGNPVTGQTVNIKVQRVSDDSVYDFSDGLFKHSGWTTPLSTMTYNAGGEYYSRTFTPDAAINTVTEYVVIVSNDDATYSDQQTQTVRFGRTDDIVKIHR